MFSKFAEVGEGLFVKRDLVIGSVVAHYNGFHIRNNRKLYHANMTSQEAEERQKNLLTFNSTHDVDLPAPYDNIVNYRATLGHKANHSFMPNARFARVKNPR